MSQPWRAISFDCFGTLIDWKFGQKRILQQLPSLAGAPDRLAEVIEARELAEQQLQAGPWMRYSEVLAQSLKTASKQVLGRELSLREAEAFAAGQLGWPAFEDTPAALARLAKVLPVILLSNCDEHELSLAAHKHLGIEPALTISAEHVRSYKPAHAHWLALLEASKLEPQQILHVSFTRVYDLDTAHELGFGLGFIGRYGTPVPEDLPLAVQADDLAGFVDALGID